MAMAAAVRTARIKVLVPDRGSPVSKSHMKLVNTSPGTSTISAPMMVAPVSMARPVARAPYTAPPRMAAAATVLKKKFTCNLSMGRTDRPASRAAPPPTSASSQFPPANSRVKNIPPRK